MDKLKANGMEYPAQICGKQIDRDWDGRASKTIVLAMPYAQAAQLVCRPVRRWRGRPGAGAGLLRLLRRGTDHGQPGRDAHN